MDKSTIQLIRIRTKVSEFKKGEGGLVLKIEIFFEIRDFSLIVEDSAKEEEPDSESIFFWGAGEQWMDKHGHC